MREKIEVRAHRGPWNRWIELVAFTGNSAAVNVEMRKIEDGEPLELVPIFRLHETEAQTLMDDLWHAGIRPTEGSGSAGSMRATEKHLADMRVIAFNKLGIDRDVK